MSKISAAGITLILLGVGMILMGTGNKYFAGCTLGACVGWSIRNLFVRE